jgi:hypothetical protein
MIALARVFIGAAFALLLLHDATKPAHADYSVRCESRDGRYTTCSADTRRGVWLSQQLSDAGCWQGESWGYNARGIWVNNGCRAEFRLGARSNDRGSDNAAAAALVVGVIGAIIASNNRDDNRDRRDGRPYPGWQPGYDRTVRCESRNNDRQRCDANLRGRRVEVARQLSSSPCTYRYSWGYDRRGIWVDRGCRADFSIW